IRVRADDGRKRAKARGVKFGRTAHQRQEALQRLADGAVQADLARSYGVSEATIAGSLLPALSSTARSACEARQTLAAGRRLAARFRTIQVYPKDLRALPGHPEPAVSWHSGFREGSPCST